MKKRICAVIMCLLLAVNLVGTPKAKAVVSEGALLGSIFGSLLVSLGYSWAADNFDAPSFGEAIYDLIKQCDEEMDTGIQLLLDTNLAGVTAVGNGKLAFSQQWVKLANSFAQWFYDKFGFADKSSATIIDTDISFSVSAWGNSGCVLNYPTSVTFDGTYGYQRFDYHPTVPGRYIATKNNPKPSSSSDVYIYFISAGYGNFTEVFGKDLDGNEIGNLDRSNNNTTVVWDVTQDMIDSGIVFQMRVSNTINTVNSGTYPLYDYASLNYAGASSLTAEKPQEIHYPDVAEDGSQVYEITVDGVTATDIEGIIQGAVDQILAGTAAIAGEVVQAQDVPVEPEVPAAGEYAVPGLETIFPFCIPFDIYAFCSALNADPVAPSFEWRMQYAPLGLDYTFEIDLSAFDGVAQVLRTMELLAFCVGLAFWTRHLIRG